MYGSVGPWDSLFPGNGCYFVTVNREFLQTSVGPGSGHRDVESLLSSGGPRLCHLTPLGYSVLSITLSCS